MGSNREILQEESLGRVYTLYFWNNSSPMILKIVIILLPDIAEVKE